MTVIYVTKPTVRPVWGSTATTGPTGGLIDPDLPIAQNGQGPGYVAGGWALSTLPPAREYWNWVLNYCMNGVAYHSRRSITEWDANQTYFLHDVCMNNTTGVVYQSLFDANTNNPPGTSPAAWGGLNGYALTGSLGGFVTQPQLTTQLASYVTNAALSQVLQNYVTQTSLATQLAQYATNGFALACRDAAISSSESFTLSQLNAYYTQAQINTSLAPLTTKSYVDTNFSTFNYLKQNYFTQADTQGQITGYLAQYYTQAQINSLLASYDPTTDVNNKITNLSNRITAITPVLIGDPNGGAELGGGVQFRYGVFTANASPVHINFANSGFNNKCLSIVWSNIDGRQNNSGYFGGVTANGFSWYGGNNDIINYIAIGY